jgi:membrane protease YdiL (CAAX protease family)
MGAVGMIIAPPAFPTAALAAGMLLAALGAATQEMFFRGWIQPVLGAAWGVWPGLFVTSLAFAAFHVAAGAHGPLVVLNLLLAGLLLGLLALRSGGLMTSSAAHLIWAWTGFAGLATSPVQLTIQVRLRGPVLWSGRDAGLGGSLAVTAVLLILLLAIVTLRSEADGAPTASEPSS